MIDQVSAFLTTPWGNALAVGLLILWPAMRILRRAGQPPLLALLGFVPLVGVLALLGVLALRRWPPGPNNRPGTSG